jgi:hypothetical protein
MKKERIDQISNTFKTFDDMFSLVKKGDLSFLNRECGTNNYPEINWMMDHFLANEEYEKCDFLSKLELPQTSRETLNKESEWLKSNFKRK